MDNIRWISKLCLVVAIGLELGAIFINLREGYSAFYLFDIADKFSIDNRFFLLYWGAILGIIFVYTDDNLVKVSSKLKEGLESLKSTPNSHEEIDKTNSREEIEKQRKKKIQEREYSMQREREFIKEEVAKSRGYDSELQNQQIKYSKILPSRQTLIKDITWEVQASDLYSELKPDSRWYFKTKIDRESFEAFMFINDRDFKELEYKGVSVVVDYQEWLSSSEGRKWKKPSKFENSNTPKKEPVKEPVKETKETIETSEDKLKKLKDLYDKELISKEVYEKQQLEILSE